MRIRITGYKRTAIPRKYPDGSFHFNDVPPNSVSAGSFRNGLTPVSQALTVRTAVPISLKNSPGN